MWLSKKEMKSNYPSFCEYLRRVDFQGAGGDENHSFHFDWPNKGNNKITELRTILQRESPNS